MQGAERALAAIARLLWKAADLNDRHRRASRELRMLRADVAMLQVEARRARVEMVPLLSDESARVRAARLLLALEDPSALSSARCWASSSCFRAPSC